MEKLLHYVYHATNKGLLDPQLVHTGERLGWVNYSVSRKTNQQTRSCFSIIQPSIGQYVCACSPYNTQLFLNFIVNSMGKLMSNQQLCIDLPSLVSASL